MAVATARLRMQPATVERIREGKVEKGDVLAAARLAGVMATKRTPDLVPLCHPIALTGVEVTLTPGRGRAGGARRGAHGGPHRRGDGGAHRGAARRRSPSTTWCKSVDRGMVIEQVQLEHKSGGRSGTWDR